MLGQMEVEDQSQICHQGSLEQKSLKGSVWVIWLLNRELEGWGKGSGRECQRLALSGVCELDPSEHHLFPSSASLRSAVGIPKLQMREEGRNLSESWGEHAE